MFPTRAVSINMTRSLPGSTTSGIINISSTLLLTETAQVILDRIIASVISGQPVWDGYSRRRDGLKIGNGLVLQRSPPITGPAGQTGLHLTNISPTGRR